MNADQNQIQDQSLLRRFATTRDEAAFHQLVEKYTGLVFGVAMRRTGDRQSAEEVLQLVFLALAKKAATLDKQRSLGAWLHRAATLESLKSLRNDATRRRHLDMIRQQQETSADGARDEQAWREVRPLLDRLLDRLPTRDREILVLHYFEGLGFNEVAITVGSTAAAVQKRSVRALKKLSASLRKRGAIIPLGVLTAGLGTELAPAAPMSLSTQVASHVLAPTPGTISAVSFTTIATAITTSKIALTAAFILAASVPIGIKVSNSHPAGQAEVRPGSSGQIRIPLHRTVAPGFDPDRFRTTLLQLIESDYHLVTEMERQLEQERPFQRLLLSLNLEDIRAAIAILDEIAISHRRLHRLDASAFSRWAELEPKTASDEAAQRKGYFPLRGAWDTWAHRDWDAAREWLRSLGSDHDPKFLLSSYFEQMAAIDGEVAVGRAKQLGEDLPDYAGDYLNLVLTAWTRHGPDKAIAWMKEELDDPEQRDKFIGDALVVLADSDPEKALDQASLLGGNRDRINEVRHNIYSAWALHQPSEAADYFVQSGAAGRWDDASVRAAGTALVRNFPARTIEISRAIDSPQKLQHFYAGILSGATESDIELVIEAADGISVDLSARWPMDDSSAMFGGFLRKWASHDRKAAFEWIDNLPEGPKKTLAGTCSPTAS